MRHVGDVLAFYTRRDWPSNHFERAFTLRGITFSSAEQALMYTKAMHFKDSATADEILRTHEPQAQKILGRRVTPYNDPEWRAARFPYYVIILKAKYGQNPDLLEELLQTDPLILVEASERDRQWGVGLAESDDRIGDPDQWLGENLCGQGHMVVREHFLKQRFE